MTKKKQKNLTFSIIGAVIITTAVFAFVAYTGPLNKEGEFLRQEASAYENVMLQIPDTNVVAGSSDNIVEIEMMNFFFSAR